MMSSPSDPDEVVADGLVRALAARGIQAQSWQSGGGTYVVLVETPLRKKQLWGLAAGTWGGYDVDDDGDEIPGTALITRIAPEDADNAAEVIAQT